MKQNLTKNEKMKLRQILRAVDQLELTIKYFGQIKGLYKVHKKKKVSEADDLAANIRQHVNTLNDIYNALNAASLSNPDNSM